jgi:homogentisate 1,2-dioxygenase
VGCTTSKWTEQPRQVNARVTDSKQDKFSANKKAQELLARVKQDKIAEKKRLAPYYIGGFEHGANTSDTEGVHSKELKPYLNGTRTEATNGSTTTEATDGSTTNGATNGSTNGI